jgi:cytoskeletal protein CcmA (bactofilin family)
VAIKLQEGGITVPGTMTVSNQLNVGGIAEITGASKLKSTLDVTGVAEITGATKLKSTLDVTGNITGKTIKELQDKITALEGKLNKYYIICK